MANYGGLGGHPEAIIWRLLEGILSVGGCWNGVRIYTRTPSESTWRTHSGETIIYFDHIFGFKYNDGSNLNRRVYLVFLQSRQEFMNGCGHFLSSSLFWDGVIASNLVD